MKKFFRTLALVLALTLVIGTIPAAAADEVKPLTKKTLYIGGAQGTNADGKQSTYKAKVALYKLAGYKTKADAEGVAISAVAADEKVRVTKSYVYAEELGKTNVTLTVDGVESSVAITVKKNAEAVKVVGLEEGEVVVGTTVEFSLPRKGSDTDARRVTVNGTALDDIEGKDRCYSYKFDKAGEYEFVLEAFQSKYYPVATAKETVKVTVVEPTVVSAKQVASNKVAVTFDCDVTNAISAASFVENCVYTKLADLQITAGLIKEVKIDKEVATVELYQSFVEATEYFVTVAGQEVGFKSAENKIENVDYITVDVETPVVGKDAKITVKYFNADGVELSLANEATLSVDSEAGWLNGKALYMYEADKSATVKAVLDIGYDPDTYELVSKEASATVVSVAKTAATTTSKVWSFGTDATKGIQEIRMGDAAKEISAKYTYSEGEPETKTFTGTNGYVVKVSDEKIAMVDADGKIFGVNQGSTVVIISKDDKVVEAFQIKVLEANKAATATIEVSKNKVNLFPSVNDEAILKVEVKDLDGNKVTSGYDVEVKQVENNATASGYTLTANAVTFSAATIVTNKAITVESSNIKFTVTVKAGSNTIATKDIVIAVGSFDPDDTDLKCTYTVKADKNALDSSIKLSDESLANTAKITLEKTYNGFYVATENFTILDKVADLNSKTTGASNSAVNYIIWTPAKDAVADLIATDAAFITVTNLASQKQQVAGNFTAVGYRLSYGSDGKLTAKQPIGSQTITVTKSDAPVSFTVIDGKRTAAAVVVTGASAAFKASWCGKNSVDDNGIVNVVAVNAKTDAESGNVFVYDFTVEVASTTYGKKQIKVNVNDLFYAK